VRAIFAHDFQDTGFNKSPHVKRRVLTLSPSLRGVFEKSRSTAAAGFTNEGRTRSFEITGLTGTRRKWVGGETLQGGKDEGFCSGQDRDLEKKLRRDLLRSLLGKSHHYPLTKRKKKRSDIEVGGRGRVW